MVNIDLVLTSICPAITRLCPQLVVFTRFNSMPSFKMPCLQLPWKNLWAESLKPVINKCYEDNTRPQFPREGTVQKL